MALFEPQPSLQDSTKFDPISTSLDFPTILSFVYRESSTALCQTWRTRYYAFMPPETGWPTYPHSNQDLIFVTFYDLQGYGQGILTCLHMVKTFTIGQYLVNRAFQILATVALIVLYLKPIYNFYFHHCLSNEYLRNYKEILFNSM
jgi:hypothetical protein